jgi:hypothetical protein
MSFKYCMLTKVVNSIAHYTMQISHNPLKCTSMISPGFDMNLLNLLTTNEILGLVALARYMNESMI